MKMPSMPPSFGSKDYWEQRFNNDPMAFDWLAPSEALDDAIKDAIEAFGGHRPTVLHIGCGTSDLSLRLRSHFDPQFITNLDFALGAIEIGRNAEIMDSTASEGHMRWAVGDLLDLSFVESELRLNERKRHPYDIVIDKSTSDSISCAEDVLVRLPYSFNDGMPDYLTTAKIPPINVLAVHLAALTPPSNGRWISFSFSDDRFPFLQAQWRDQPDEEPLDEQGDEAFPDPARLWRLEKKKAVPAPEQPSGHVQASPVYRPAIYHWLYVLLRTEETVPGLR
jgi:EEF1A lysine methyltransferase 4